MKFADASLKPSKNGRCSCSHLSLHTSWSSHLMVFTPVIVIIDTFLIRRAPRDGEMYGGRASGNLPSKCVLKVRGLDRLGRMTDASCALGCYTIRTNKGRPRMYNSPVAPSAQLSVNGTATALVRTPLVPDTTAAVVSRSSVALRWLADLSTLCTVARARSRTCACSSLTASGLSSCRQYAAASSGSAAVRRVSIRWPSPVVIRTVPSRPGHRTGHVAGERAASSICSVWYLVVVGRWNRLCSHRKGSFRSKPRKAPTPPGTRSRLRPQRTAGLVGAVRTGRPFCHEDLACFLPLSLVSVSYANMLAFTSRCFRAIIITNQV